MISMGVELTDLNALLPICDAQVNQLCDEIVQFVWQKLHSGAQRMLSAMRTPLCLLPEGNNEYTVVYAAFSDPNKRFHPMGMVKLRMNHAVLEQLVKGL